MMKFYAIRLNLKFQIALEAASKATRKVPIKKVVVGIKGEIQSEEWI